MLGNDLFFVYVFFLVLQHHKSISQREREVQSEVELEYVVVHRYAARVVRQKNDE